MKKPYLLFFLLFLSACTPITEKTKDNTTMFCGQSTFGSCSDNSDCIRSGCSSQICQNKSEEMIATTCEWSECYDSVAYGVKCSCVTSKCQWSP